MASAAEKKSASSKRSVLVKETSGGHGPSTLVAEPVASDLRFVRVSGSTYLVVALEDGRLVSTPLEWYPTLDDAKHSARRNWMLIDRGRGFSWPELGLDLSVRGMLLGIPDATRRARTIRPPTSAYARLLGKLHASARPGEGAARLAG